MFFYFPLSALRKKRLCRCQTTVIVVVVIMLEVTVVAVEVIGIVGLTILATTDLDIVLYLDLIYPPIVIYLLPPAPYSFDLDLDPISIPYPVPSIDHHQISGCP